MNTKIIGTIIIILGLAGILGGAFIVYKQMFFVPDEPINTVVEVEVEEENNTSTNGNLINIPVETENGSIDKIINLQDKKSVVVSNNQNIANESVIEDQLKRTASLFIERFGSYSNQSNFSNVADLKIYMSEDMKQWADDFVRKNNIDRDISVYYGITTKSISQRVEFIDEAGGGASILVNTLRRESGGTLQDDNSFYQEAEIKFVLEKGFWKVNKANWK